MSLSNYSKAAASVGEELRDMLRAPEYGDMLDALSLDALRTLADFRAANDAAVQSIATATPKPRQALLRKLDQTQRFWAIAAAAQVAFEASAMLYEADICLQPGGPYRQMIGTAQAVLDAVHEHPDALWPFPTLSPFYPDYYEEEE